MSIKKWKPKTKERNIHWGGEKHISEEILHNSWTVFLLVLLFLIGLKKEQSHIGTCHVGERNERIKCSLKPFLSVMNSKRNSGRHVSLCCCNRYKQQVFTLLPIEHKHDSAQAKSRKNHDEENHGNPQVNFKNIPKNGVKTEIKGNWNWRKDKQLCLSVAFLLFSDTSYYSQM